MTGGRLKRVLPYVEGEDFCFTYGDGLADVDIGRGRSRYHREQGTLATLTAVQPPGRFGALEVQGSACRASRRSRAATAPGATAGSSCSPPRWAATSTATRPCGRRSPLRMLASEGQLAAYRHRGLLAGDGHAARPQLAERLWSSGAAPWRVWS